jgi:hypothetical protein
MVDMKRSANIFVDAEDVRLRLETGSVPLTERGLAFREIDREAV